jgi:hypothetical protein
MLKRISLTGTFLSLLAFTYSQTVSIPKGIKYKVTSNTNNDKAKLLLKNVITKNLSDSIFDNVCYIGPILWVRYKEIDSINAIRGGYIQFNVPVYNKISKNKVTQKMDGKLIQAKPDFKKVWNQVCIDLKDTITFRKLTASELSYYWAIIFYDIEEPVFITESKSNKILLQLNPKTNKILWIDEIPN